MEKRSMTARHISERGLALIRRLEGWSGKAYADAAGKATIGYGHLLMPSESFDELTSEQAEVLLRHDVARVEKALREYVRVPLNQSQYDALASFIYNVGVAAFAHSTLLEKLNNNSYAEAADELLRWTKVKNERGYEHSPGLTARRATERNMFIETPEA